MDETYGLPTLVSVVIPLYNDADYVGRQLDALASQVYDGQWEVVVADNGSTDGGLEVVRRRASAFPAVQIVDASSRRGPSHARNVGAAAARGDLLLFCDADDVVAPGWLEHMAEASRSASLIICSDDHSLNSVRGWAGPQRRISAESFPFLPWGRGGAIGVRARVFHEVGGWDERRELGEDVELCWRLQLAGYTCALVPDASVFYLLRRRTRDLIVQQFRFGKSAVQLYIEFRAHGYERQRGLTLLRAYLWLVTRTPYIVMPSRRRLWIILSAQRAGRLWGSLRLGVWCP